jgi:hypothetical protein
MPSKGTRAVQTAILMLRRLTGIVIAAVLSLPIVADQASGHPRRRGETPRGTP